MKSDIKRVAIVTGASSGNGRAIALKLAERGMSVVCSDIQEECKSGGYEELPEVPTHQLIEQRGGEALFAKCDVSNSTDVQQLFDTALTLTGRLDVLVNNAGIFAGLGSILSETEEAFDKTMAVNTKGVWLCSKAALSVMVTQEESAEGSKGAIINIASIGGLVGLEEEPSYCASKGAVVNLTRQLAVDFAAEKIRVNAVCPGFLKTAMVRPFLEDPEQHQRLLNDSPWPHLGSAQDVADACAFLAGPDAGWVTGSILTVDGGFTAR